MGGRRERWRERRERISSFAVCRYEYLIYGTLAAKEIGDAKAAFSLARYGFGPRLISKQCLLHTSILLYIIALRPEWTAKERGVRTC